MLEYFSLPICSLEGPPYEKAVGHADENRHSAVSHVGNASLVATEGNPSAALALNGRMRLTGAFIDATLSGYWTPMSMFALEVNVAFANRHTDTFKSFIVIFANWKKCATKLGFQCLRLTQMFHP